MVEANKTPDVLIVEDTLSMALMYVYCYYGKRVC